MGKQWNDEEAHADQYASNQLRILTVLDVADILKVPVSWVYDHTRPRCCNPLPCFKIGKYLRFYAADIYAYVERMRSRIKYLS